MKMIIRLTKVFNTLQSGLRRMTRRVPSSNLLLKILEDTRTISHKTKTFQCKGVGAMFSAEMAEVAKRLSSLRPLVITLK